MGLISKVLWTIAFVLFSQWAYSRPVALAFQEGIRYDAVKRELKHPGIPAEELVRIGKIREELDASIAANVALMGGSIINAEDFKGELATEAKLRYRKQKALVKELEDLLGLTAYSSQADYNDFFRGGRTYDEEECLFRSTGNRRVPIRNEAELQSRLEQIMQYDYFGVEDKLTSFRREGFSNAMQAKVLWRISEIYREAAGDSKQHKILLNALYWFNRLAGDGQAFCLKELAVRKEFLGRYAARLLRQRGEECWRSMWRRTRIVEEFEEFHKEGLPGGKPAFIERIRPYAASSDEIISALFIVADSCCQKSHGSALENLGVMALEFTVPLEDIPDKESRPDYRYSFIAHTSRNACAWTALKCHFEYHERMDSPFGKWNLRSELRHSKWTQEEREKIEALIKTSRWTKD